MKTRFDNSQEWITGQGEVVCIKDMETTHLMNIIRMFIKKPFITASMIIRDIEDNRYCPFTSAWNPNQKSEIDVKKESIFNVTSMTDKELITYALNSRLGSALTNELSNRGVNLDNFITSTMNETAE